MSSASPGTVILWFRQDLRLADNPALDAAVRSGACIVPVYIWSPEEEGGWPPGSASRWWLHRSLEELDRRLEGKGSRLLIRRGPALIALRELAAQCGAQAVYWNRRYEPAAVAVEKMLREMLPHAGLLAHSFQASLLAEPWSLQTKTGGPYQVFTPYWRAFLQQVKVDAPLGSPASIPSPAGWPASLPLEDLRLVPRIPWHQSLEAHWTPGEAAARERLLSFSKGALKDYASGRDLPAIDGTSQLSPHLHFGELSPRQVWSQASRFSDPSGRYHAEIVWREFAAHLLHHFPTLPERPKNPAFEKLAWRNEPADFEAWCRGRTGVSLVDAGLRQLWQTGWMHNRVRMVVGSFLVKNLLHAWQDGERWFWDTLVDADLASNAMGWQWVAGTGPDAAPFFRVFNADTQAEKFDATGEYRRRWIPELGTPAYPKPIVDLKSTRQRALDAYQAIRGR